MYIALSHGDENQTTEDLIKLRLTEVFVRSIVLQFMSNIQELQHAILYTLTYADVFDYPLNAPEIHRYLTGVKASQEDMECALKKLTHEVGYDGRYYFLAGREAIVKVRINRAQVASQLWKKAILYGHVIASLPFVRMVTVTGSLAMDNTDEGKDIDYMIVTAKGYLWTCRAMSLIITRIARLNGVTLCPNYLVTENALKLEEHSLYVARELAQMIPLSGMEVYAQIRCLNSWVNEYLPNSQGAPKLPADINPPQVPFLFQRLMEFVLKILPTRLFERWEMNRKVTKLSREQGSSPEAKFTADICKGHVDRHGQKTEIAIREKLEQIF